MDKPAPLIDPREWMFRLFSARAAAEGAAVRRKVSDIERIVGRERFLAELDRRGFQAIENAGQMVIFCNREPVHLLRVVAPSSRSRPRQIPNKEFAKSL